ncbi:MAG TPA: Hsp70 family protein [Sporichthya sp.]|nr:Hsp70 family protein [Sporichthya sp.]
MSPVAHDQGGWRAMGYRLGVDLGTTFTAAVVHRPGATPTVVPLGDRAAAIPSVLFLGADGTVLMGEAAERRALTEPERVVRRFKRRIGDETPLLVGPGGNGFTAHAIAARMIALVCDRVAEQEGGAPESIAVTVPAAWAAHKKELLAAALVREGLLGVTLVSEPVAAALAYAGTGRLGAGTTLAVYDFGGGTFDAALLRAGSEGRFSSLGSPTGLPNLGGIDFDDAVLAYVLGTAGPQTPGVDSDEALHVTAMGRLRRECVEAKEALSADTTVTVPVLLGAAQTSVRLTRGEFEAMIAGAVEETCTALEAALVSAGLTRNNLDRILLAGGSSRIPLVTQLLSARYPGVTLERDIDPKLAVAIGSVLALEQATRAGGRHAAPRPVTESAAALLPAAPVAVAAVTAKPERPALELAGFSAREPGVPVVTQRRKTPKVLMVAAAVIMFGGFGLSHFVELGGALPGPGLQEARAGTDRGDATELEVEAAKGAKTDAKAEDAKVASESAATSESTDSSGGTAGGRSEGSADTRSAESSAKSSDASTADKASGKAAGAETGTADKATGGRKTAKADKAQAGDSAASAPAAQPASAEVAPAAAAAPAAPAPAPAAEDTSTDSGSVEFNSGAPPAP